MGEETNGRITMAILGEKLDALNRKVDEMSKKLEHINQNSEAIARLQENYKDQEKDIENLNIRVNGWSSINSVGTFIAALVGIFVNPNK